MNHELISVNLSSSPLQVVQLVGEHGIGKASLQPFKLPKQKITLGELNEMLQARK